MEHMITRLFFVVAVVALSVFPWGVLAEESSFAQPEAALWISSSQGQAPWLDETPNQWPSGDVSILSVGHSVVLVQLSDNRVMAASNTLMPLGIIHVPPGTMWLSLDHRDRLFAFAGSVLMSAPSYREAMAEGGFFPVFEIPGLQAIDNAGTAVIFADNQTVTLLDLDNGQSMSVALSDFFIPGEDLPVVRAAQASSAQPQSAANAGGFQSISVQGLWIRHDGVGLIRLRRLLDTRLFVTRDGGQSWEPMSEAPHVILHQAGWIWDGMSRVLSRDGHSWVEVCGPLIPLVDRFTPSHTLHDAEPVKLSWNMPQSPDMEAPPKEEELSADMPEMGCHEVDFIGIWESHPVQESESASWFWPDEGSQMGTLYRLMRDARRDAEHIQAPSAFIRRPHEAIPEPLSLPASCMPVYLGNARGLGVLLCEPSDAQSEIAVYVRSDASDWVYEAQLPQVFALETTLESAPDGTILLRGSCVEPDVKRSPNDSQQNPEALPEAVSNLCYAAIRLDDAVGKPDLWRVERLPDVIDYHVIGRGQVLALTQNDSAYSLWQLTPNASTRRLEAFEPVPGSVLTMTQEGCLAFYTDETAGLVSVHGGVANLDCETSALMAQTALSSTESEQVIGDNRYGIRLGGGGFFSTNDVMTWFMRAEALFPIYGGQYEIAGIFRMSGGNTNAKMGYLGILAVRWRYDGLSLFDFAVGAGVGFGTMCGYDASADPAANGEDESKEISGYKHCSTASMRYLISGVAAYKFSKNWKLFIATELIGGTSWGFDLTGGIEIRF